MMTAKRQQKQLRRRKIILDCEEIVILSRPKLEYLIHCGLKVFCRRFRKAVAICIPPSNVGRSSPHQSATNDAH